MSYSGKIGVGIVTCGRKNTFEKLYSSLKPCEYIIDRLYTVEDKSPKSEGLSPLPYSFDIVNSWKGSSGSWICGKNQGVAKSKNLALKDLMDSGCDHIFLMEDDIYIKNPKVFESYINASKASGIQHFNYSQHGMMNKSWPGGNPNPRIIIKYNES